MTRETDGSEAEKEVSLSIENLTTMDRGSSPLRGGENFALQCS